MNIDIALDILNKFSEEELIKCIDKAKIEKEITNALRTKIKDFSEESIQEAFQRPEMKQLITNYVTFVHWVAKTKIQELKNR